MSGAALSPAQFGDGGAATWRPPPQAEPGATPLPLGENTYGSTKSHAAWRMPSSTMPLGKSTFGSVFTPYEA